MDTTLRLFDGFPYLATRVVPSLYHVIVLPDELTEGELIDLAKGQASANRLESCLVLGTERAIYIGEDGTPSEPGLPPYGGVIVTDKLVPVREFEPTESLTDRHARLAAFISEQPQTGFILRRRVFEAPVERAGFGARRGIEGWVISRVLNARLTRLSDQGHELTKELRQRVLAEILAQRAAAERNRRPGGNNVVRLRDPRR